MLPLVKDSLRGRIKYNITLIIFSRIVSKNNYISSFSTRFQIIDKNALQKMHPYLHTNDLVGAVWVPEDAVANPLAICKAFAQLAVEGGKHSIYISFL